MKYTPLYPLKFTPILKPKVWGGRRLAAWGKTLGKGERIGESWELADRPGARSVVANGPLAGRTLHALLRTRRVELLGAGLAARFTGGFPLLVKLIHAREDLSIQVHPDDAAARRFSGQQHGKAEAWYVLETRPGASVIVGLKRGVTQRQLARAMRDRCVAELAHRVSVGPGDALFVRPGTVHAIGAGIVLAEVQENSDLTYRLYDWDRAGKRPRLLHIREALGSIDFNAPPPRVPRAAAARRRKLAQCDQFTLQWRRGPFEERVAAFRGLCVARGRGRILYGDGFSESCHVRRGDTVLIPASVGRYRVEAGAALETLLWGSGSLVSA